MAKINIPFNNTNYSIDESALSAATSALRTHLSTVMNGSGATINLGGITFNIDSTKLSTATNAFVSHLGTIAGNGSKVVIGGVEYSIGSDKLANAISELETVLGGLQSGGSGGADTDILPETTITGFAANPNYYGLIMANSDPVYELIVGETYMVNWDGETFECVAQDVSSVLGDGAVGIGDGSNFGFSGNNEPFIIIGDGWLRPAYIALTDTEDGGTHTVRIYQTANSAPPAREVILAEQTVTIPSDSLNSGNLPVSFELAPNEEYTVVYDGVEYTCVAQDTSSVWGGVMDAGMQLGLGNWTNRGFAGNSEPFALNWITQEAAEKFSFGTTPMIAVEVFSNENAGEHTLAIYK